MREVREGGEEGREGREGERKEEEEGGAGEREAEREREREGKSDTFRSCLSTRGHLSLAYESTSSHTACDTSAAFQ